MPSSRGTWQRFQSLATMSWVVVMQPLLLSCQSPRYVIDLYRCLPHDLSEVVQDIIELSLENSVEPLITTHGLKLTAVDGLAIHHSFLLQLLADAFEPLALRRGPGLAGKNRLQCRLHALTVRQQGLT